MAAPEKWWIAIRPHSTKLLIIESPSRPTGYETVLGSYPTKEAAQDVVGTIDKPPVPAQPPVSIPNPLSGIGAVGHWLGEGILHLIDFPMWRSLGWLALGAILVIAGVYLWFRTSASYKELQSAIIGTVKAL